MTVMIRASLSAGCVIAMFVPTVILAQIIPWTKEQKTAHCRQEAEHSIIPFTKEQIDLKCEPMGQRVSVKPVSNEPRGDEPTARQQEQAAQDANPVTNNSEQFGLNSQDVAELDRLKATPVFKELGGPLFQGVAIVRRNAALYSQVDRDMADWVIKGMSPEKARERGRWEKQRFLAAHDDAKEVVLRTCEDAKAVPSTWARTYGYSREDVSTVRELLLKMFKFAGVECHVPLASAAPRP